MKKIIILLLVSFLFISCTKNNKGENMAEESSRIVDEYVETLEGSVQDARAAKELMELNQQKLQKGIQDAYK